MEPAKSWNSAPARPLIQPWMPKRWFHAIPSNSGYTTATSANDVRANLQVRDYFVPRVSLGGIWSASPVVSSSHPLGSDSRKNLCQALATCCGIGAEW